MKTISNFNVSEYYEENVLPLVLQIKKLCIKENLPMFLCICTKNSAKETSYEYEILADFEPSTILSQIDLLRHHSEIDVNLVLFILGFHVNRIFIFS